jgi:hypothetical protein
VTCRASLQPICWAGVKETEIKLKKTKELMSYFLFKEQITIKTGICIILSIIIILINIK